VFLRWHVRRCLGRLMVVYELTAHIERENLVEGHACSLGDASHLLHEVRRELLRDRKPLEYRIGDRSPAHSGLLGEGFPVVPERALDQVARTFSILAAALAS